MIAVSAPVRVLRFLLLTALAASLLAACDSQNASESAADKAVTVSGLDVDGRPEVAQAAVNETCAALTHLQQEWRLGRVDDTQYVKAYDDIRASLDASGARVGLPLGDAVAESCPSGWHDGIATRGEISDQAKADLAQPYCDDLARIVTIRGARFSSAYDSFLDSIVVESRRLGRPYLLAELVGAHCPALWLDGVARWEEMRASEDAPERQRLREEQAEVEKQQQADATPAPTPKTVTASVQPTARPALGATPTSSPSSNPDLAVSPTPAGTGLRPVSSAMTPAQPPVENVADSNVILLRHYEDKGVYWFDVTTGTVEFIDFRLSAVYGFDISPDKIRLAISGDRGESDEPKLEIFIFDIRGRELRNVEAPECWPTNPRWSSGGERITLNCGWRDGDIGMIELETLSLTRLDARRLIFSSDDSKAIDVSHDFEEDYGYVNVHDFEARTYRSYRLVDEATEKGVSPVHMQSYALSSDGSKLAFEGTYSAEPGGNGIFIIDGPFSSAHNSDFVARRLKSIDDSSFHATPDLTFSPDGELLVFSANHSAYGVFGVFAVNDQRDEIEQLVFGSDFEPKVLHDEISIVFSNDGTYVAVFGWVPSRAAEQSRGAVRVLRFGDRKSELIDTVSLEENFEARVPPEFSDDGNMVAVFGCTPQCASLGKTGGSPSLRILDVSTGEYDEFVFPEEDVLWYSVKGILYFGPER